MMGALNSGTNSSYHGMGWLRVQREVELAGLDTHDYGDAFPYFAYRDTKMEEIDRQLAKGQH